MVAPNSSVTQTGLEVQTTLNPDRTPTGNLQSGGQVFGTVLSVSNAALIEDLVSGAGDVLNLIAPGLLSGVTYDSSNRATAWNIDGVTYTANYNGAGITVAGTDGTITNISVDPAQRITAVAGP
jgi:hypothetical protein